MSIEHGASGRRSIQVEAAVPGTPEEVWEAIATGPGIGSWFYRTELEERVGGVLKYHTGSEMIHVPATVTVWDPPRRFRHKGKDCGLEGPPTATEWTIEPRSRGRCLVRVVHSLFANTDEWDNYLERFEDGWPQALAILRLYLTHFRGQRATIARASGNHPGSVRDAWQVLLGKLDAVGLAPGDRWALPEGGDAGLGGVLDEIRPEGRQPYLLLRLDEPAPGIAAASAYPVSARAAVMLNLYLYGDEGARAAGAEVAWQAWVNACFA
ncbi:MAG: SRPBCC domain-containing protein [Gammaproteobacteria bacterium]|nr:SRPBCC domain-containing protein [Gammaproteobacteria bacterium]MDE0444969.1 SRPBCC domain-containing protein [Gammaproteobacteria bacterium]